MKPAFLVATYASLLFGIATIVLLVYRRNVGRLLCLTVFLALSCTRTVALVALPDFAAYRDLYYRTDAAMVFLVACVVVELLYRMWEQLLPAAQGRAAVVVTSYAVFTVFMAGSIGGMLGWFVLSLMTAVLVAVAIYIHRWSFDQDTVLRWHSWTVLWFLVLNAAGYALISFVGGRHWNTVGSWCIMSAIIGAEMAWCWMMRR